MAEPEIGNAVDLDQTRRGEDQLRLLRSRRKNLAGSRLGGRRLGDKHQRNQTGNRERHCHTAPFQKWRPEAQVRGAFARHSLRNLVRPGMRVHTRASLGKRDRDCILAI